MAQITFIFGSGAELVLKFSPSSRTPSSSWLGACETSYTPLTWPDLTWCSCGAAWDVPVCLGTSFHSDRTEDEPSSGHVAECWRKHQGTGAQRDGGQRTDHSGSLWWLLCSRRSLLEIISAQISRQLCVRKLRQRVWTGVVNLESGLGQTVRLLLPCVCSTCWEWPHVYSQLAGLYWQGTPPHSEW